MINVQQLLDAAPAPPLVVPPKGGIQFKDAAPILCSVVDNGVSEDDERVMTRCNEATKIVLDTMIPVGGMATTLVTANNTGLILPPELENSIESYPVDPSTRLYGNSDATDSWYEIVNSSVYIDPFQQHDNPLVDLGLWPVNWTGYEGQLVRVYAFPGLEPPNADVVITGKKRYIPIKNREDYLIVQNLEALKLIILSIERNENNAPDDAPKYRQQAFDLLQGEVKQHLLDPRNYMRRKAQYQQEAMSMVENTAGWMRANIALDHEEAMKMGRFALLWSINQIERRIMESAIRKDTVVTIQATVKGGMIYMPINVGGVYAISLDGQPIPIRSQFFQHLENGPGGFPVCPMLIDQGNHLFPGTQSTRRKYKLIANCNEGQVITAVCKLKWVMKGANDYMTIKNYEAIRLFMTAKFLEEKEDWQNAQANQATAFQILDDELKDYLGGIRHTVHVQTYGFGLGDVSGSWGH